MTNTPKKLSLFDATMLVMGGIVGIGIFFNPSGIARAVPEPGPYLAMWLIGALAALCGAMTFAELSAAYPRTGGWYVFLREGFGRMTAFLFAWVVLFVISTGACALVAMFFGRQVTTLFAIEASATPWIGCGAVVSITLLALAGLKNSARFQNLVMLLKLAAILTLVVAGLALYSGPQLLAEVQPSQVSSSSLPSGMLTASLQVLFAFGGWQLLSYIAPNVENPQRNLPRAILFGVGGVTVIYLVINVAYLKVLGIGGIASGGPGAFANVLAAVTLGESGQVFLTAAMAVSALGFLVATLITTPGIYVAMAREGLFPESFARRSPRTGAPTRALLLQATLGMAYIGWASYDGDQVDRLVSAVVFAEWIFHGLCGLALIRLAKRLGPDRPLKSPLFPLFPAAYTLIAAGVVIGNLFATDIEVTGIGLAVVALGAVVYVPWSRATART